jgi:transposase InsO family protein
VLVELGLVEQRYRAVLEVLNDGATVTDVARRYGVVRQTVHVWLREYASRGLAGLIDGSSRPASCPHQMAAELEARVVEWRRAHPTWGPRTIVSRLAREGVDPVPSRSSVYRALVRHQLIDPKRRRRRRSDYKRWERARAMELWQMDITGGVRLVDGTRPSVITGVDDYSRFCVSAKVVARATARPVCDALAEAMRSHGVPEAILTDNGKVFTGRFGKGEVLFDRICRENGIKHLLTAPHAPTTTGKVERFHKTMKASSSPASASRPSPTPSAPLTVGWPSTTTSGNTKAWGTGHRSSGSVSRTEIRSRWSNQRTSSPSRRCRVFRGTPARLGATGASASPRSTITSVAGSPVRPSRSPCATDSSRSTTTACSSPPTPGATHLTTNRHRVEGPPDVVHLRPASP